jgi:hypothetical protein
VGAAIDEPAIRERFRPGDRKLEVPLWEIARKELGVNRISA